MNTPAAPENMEYREYRHEDAEGWLALQGSRWRQVPKDFWDRWSRQPTVTSSMALLDGKVVGQIPFHIREFLLRPGVAVRAAFEHSVLVAEEMRSRGIGGALIEEAEKFLRGRADVMMVYRGGERTPGYRFYRRTRHFDLTYNRLWQAGESTPRSDAEITGSDAGALYEREDEVLEVFESAYSECGGFPRRRKGYWEEALDSIIFQEGPADFHFLYLEEAGKLCGYVLLSYRDNAGHERHSSTVLEMATRDAAAKPAVMLLRHAAHFAASKGAKLAVRNPDDSVYAGALREAGFVQTPRANRSLMVMAYVFDPQALAQKVLEQSGCRLPFGVEIWTPEREALIIPPPNNSERTVLLEMKEHDLARLLLCRLDLSGAIREERITVVGAESGDIESFSQVFRFTPWENHSLDYI